MNYSYQKFQIFFEVTNIGLLVAAFPVEMPFFLAPLFFYLDELYVAIDLDFTFIPYVTT